ncbi:MAG TPA: NifU family protein [Pirellulales bacterium]|jgi:Fe-S cluster biogenesis protein NfuA|nr:NifU family protein [Pirellulales bacterium]
MTVSSSATQLNDRLRKLETLLPEIERLPDAALRESVREIVQTLLDFHGEAVNRITQGLADAGEPGRKLFAELARDEVVGSMLLLYGLHPTDLPGRVLAALERVRPALGSHGGNVVLLGISDEGEVHLRLEGNCHGCASSQATLKSTIEQAIYAAAPDVSAVRVEGVVEPPPAGGFVPLGELAAAARTARV